MGAFIQAIGVLLRLPFFIIAVILITLLGIPWTIIQIVFRIVLLPLAFLGAAFFNNRDFKLDGIVSEPIENLAGYYRNAFSFLKSFS